MSASSHARRERTELAELMLRVGPDAPTLCGGWTTRDLAAHLVVRESRPDAGVGILFSPLSGWTDRVTRAAATRSYPELVRQVRTGPPTLSVFSIPGFDTLGNLVEYFVHHEDVRRAQPDWAPRDLPADLSDELWSRLTQLGRIMHRRVPVGVTLRRTDGPGGQCVVRKGQPLVSVTGTAQELLLRTYGRTDVQVEIDGTPEAIAAYTTANLSI
jgi:uncharacterized protein (TIGR03085 family)